MLSAAAVLCHFVSIHHRVLTAEYGSVPRCFVDSTSTLLEAANKKTGTAC
jgi:hypothetical protein